MPKFCSCGNPVGAMSVSLKCRGCKLLDKITKRKQEGRKVLEAMHAAGMVRLHSCLSDGLRDPAPVRCNCRKFVAFAEAKYFVEIGRCVDFSTRQGCFYRQEIVEASREKNPPHSTIGNRIAIERKTVTDRPTEFDGLVPRLPDVDEKQWRDIEVRGKIDLEHELSLIALQPIMKMYPEEEWQKMIAIQKTIPATTTFIGRDERTSFRPRGQRGRRKKIVHIEFAQAT